MTDTVWYVVHTKPQREAVAYGNIVAQDFTAFLPLGKEPGKPARPLFPRYLFVEIARNQNWWPIMSTRGVSTILCPASGFPVPVPLDVMAELRDRLTVLELIGQVSHSLGRAASLKPLFVLDGGPYGLFANHRRNLDAYIGDARQLMYSIREELEK